MRSSLRQRYVSPVTGPDLNRLRYFWAVATRGGVGAGARFLGVTQPTASAQIQRLEDELDVQLFHRRGRRMELTDAGRTVLRYADEIFRAGTELMTAVRGSIADTLRLEVGVANSVPKLVARALIEPAFALGRQVELICHEWSAGEMLAELGAHRLDLILTDTAAPASTPGRPITHAVGESGIGLFASPRLAAKLRPEFPRSLQDVPLIVTTVGTLLRGLLDNWFGANNLRPRIVAEMDDRAMMHHFAQLGLGAVPVPTIIGSEVSRQFGLRRIGVLRGVRDQYFAITVERKMRNPAVEAILARARQRFRAAEREQRPEA